MTVKAVVTDIEGTTSSMSFVKDVLFPYARQHIGDFVRAHQDKDVVRCLLDDARREAGEELDTEALIEQLIRWIDEDKKVTPLKTLQGLIWEAGFKESAFKGHVYEDAARSLKEWKARAINLFVYSSGSVFAQKLLFEYSHHGDLTPLFTGYFDTHIGGKRKPYAYRRIAVEVGYDPADILFLSDIKEELDAAREAGFQTVWLVREAAPDPNAEHPQVATFDQIDIG
ncbi:MAG: acireductone synthase [Pseudomonadota bacterium]